jgi:hypothetical protein
VYGARFCAVTTPSPGGHEHRRGWIVERLEQLAGVFATDVAAYAVMSNHTHLVVRVDPERAQEWSQEEVLRRWTRLYVGPELVQRYEWDGEADLCAAQLDALHGWAETYRSRLTDLSWLMRVLNQSIARMANAAVHRHHRADAAAVPHHHRHTGTPHLALPDPQHRLPARHERRSGAVRTEGGLTARHYDLLGRFVRGKTYRSTQPVLL